MKVFFDTSNRARFDFNIPIPQTSPKRAESFEAIKQEQFFGVKYFIVPQTSLGCPITATGYTSEVIVKVIKFNNYCQSQFYAVEDDDVLYLYVKENLILDEWRRLALI